MELEKFAKFDLMQKAKINQLRDGDEKSRFFDKSIKVKKNIRNNIHGLMFNGAWINDKKTIIEEARKFLA